MLKSINLREKIWGEGNLRNILLFMLDEKESSLDELREETQNIYAREKLDCWTTTISATSAFRVRDYRWNGNLGVLGAILSRAIDAAISRRRSASRYTTINISPLPWSILGCYERAPIKKRPPRLVYVQRNVPITIISGAGRPSLRIRS